MSCKGLYSALFVLFVLSLAYGQTNTNIVANPGFERGREFWFDRTCAIEAATSPVHGGSGSCKAINRGANWQGIKQSLFEKMISGKTYKVSGWVRLDNAASDTVAISFEQQDDSGTKYLGVARATATNTDWTLLSGEFIPDVNGTLSVLDVYFEGPAPGVNFFVDDVNVYGPAADAPEVLPAAPHGVGRVDVTIRHQKIEGFGGSGAYYTMDFTNHQKKDELCKLLFQDLGLDIFRIRNNYDMEPDSFKQTVEIVKTGRAVRKDLKIMLSSWSPPVALKSNGSTVGGTLKKNDKGEFVYDEFAQWWCDSVKAYTEAGVKVDYINVQNELDYEAPWNACRFAPNATTDPNLPAYDVAFEMVWQKLHAAMGSDMPRMLAPESSGLGNGQAYIENMDDMSHVYGYAHHLYDCSGCGYAPDRFIPRMTSLYNFVMLHGNKPIFQTEFEEDPGTWADALNTAHLIHNALCVEQVSAYLYWDLFWSPGSGMISMDNASSYTVKPTYYTFKNYSAFIHAGWQRVEASTDNPGVRLSAYICPDNRKLTVVLINTTRDTDIYLDLSIKGFPRSRGEVYRSSKTENCVRLSDYDKRAPLYLPASSVTTLSLASGWR